MRKKIKPLIIASLLLHSISNFAQLPRGFVCPTVDTVNQIVASSGPQYINVEGLGTFLVRRPPLDVRETGTIFIGAAITSCRLTCIYD